MLGCMGATTTYYTYHLLFFSQNIILHLLGEQYFCHLVGEQYLYSMNISNRVALFYFVREYYRVL